MRARCAGVGVPVLLLAVAALAGCGTVRLYDESKAKFATGIKDKYTKAEVLGAIEVEKRNLDNLLAEELKVVREHQQLVVDSALLRIADDGTPMADTYTRKAVSRIKALGFTDFGQVRAHRIESIEAGQRRRTLETLWPRIAKLATVPIPECKPGEPLPATLAGAVSLPASLAPGDRADAEGVYSLYRSVCARLKLPFEPDGELRSTRDEWKAAEAATAVLDRTLQSAQQDVKQKQEAYDNAVAAQNAAAGAAESVKKNLQQKAADALKALNAAKEALAQAGTHDGATLSERLNALATVLSAAAGGTIDTSDEALKKAATIAKEIPSLAGDMDALLKQSKVPPVNGLLIEMRHQLLLLEQTKQLRGYAQQRVDILRAQYDALREEAGLWLRFGDAICSYATVKANEEWPGSDCDKFGFELGTPATPAKLATATEPATSGKPATLARCKLPGKEFDCPALDKAWNENIRDESNAVATREIYKALAAYLQALAIQATENEQTFRLIDISHREALVTREAALKQWDNLVAVPVSQLDAYYQAGLKPAEIADLVVKALGFAAITVGVSK